MNKAELIHSFSTNKFKKVSFTFNEDMWDMFAEYCKKHNTKPTWEVEKHIINLLDKDVMIGK